MTFDARESSRQLGKPIGLILFTYGPNDADYYGYTDAEDVVTFAGKTYQPVPIDRDAIVVSGTMDQATLDIRLSINLDISKLFDVFPPSQEVVVAIYSGHVGDTDFKAMWFGRLLSFKFEDEQCTFTCETAFTSMRRTGLRRPYSYGCPLVLYGTGVGQCNASKGDATTTFVAAGVNGAVLTLAPGWADDATRPNYLNGTAEWITPDNRPEVRTIIRIPDSSTLLLSGAIVGLVADMNVNLVFGCDHQMGASGCTLHANINNYGGQAWIPFKNPIGITNNFF